MTCKSDWLNRTLILFSFLLVFLVMRPSVAQEEAEQDSSSEMVEVNFSDGVSLKNLISFVSQMTDRRFQYDPSVVKGKVTVISQEKIPKSSLFDLLLSTLRSKNLTAVEEGLGEDGKQIWKIIKSNRQGSSDQVVKGDDISDDNRIVSKVFRLEHVSVDQAQKVISNLVTKGSGGASSIQSVNALLVTDYENNIQQISEIINIMDEPSDPPRIEVLELSNITPSSARETLESMLPGLINKGNAKQGDGQSLLEQTQILEHPSNRALVIMATDRHMEKLLKIARELDQEGRERPSRVHVYTLDNTNAEDISSKIQSLYEQKLQAEDEQGGEQSSGSSSQALTIKAIESQNALIVNAAESMWQNQIRPLLDQIDTKRSQVLISATIVEVTGEIDQNIGIDFTQISQSSDDEIGFSTTGIAGSTLVDLNGDDIVDTFRVGGGEDTTGAVFGRFLNDRQEIFVLSKLFRQDQIINISQLPYVVARDNQEASLSVKNEIPFQETTALEGDRTQESVQFEEAGLELNITPQITEANYLRMEVLAKFNQFQGESSENLPPQKTTRELETGLTVPNRNTVVMGGLTSRVKDETGTGIAFLKDVPYLGRLFRNDELSNRKTTLYIFLTPYILRDRRFRDYRGLSREKKQGAQKLTGLDFGESDSLVGPSGSLDSFTLDSPYSEKSRSRTLDKFNDLFETSQDLSPRSGDQESME